MLPSHLHDVMGAANLSLARGDTDAAIKLCNEVIRQGKERILWWLGKVLVTENGRFLSTSCGGAILDTGNRV